MSERKFPLRSQSMIARPVAVSRNKSRTQTWAYPVVFEKHTNGDSSNSSLAPIPESDHQDPTSQTDYEQFEAQAEQIAKANVQDEEFRLIIGEVLSSYLKGFPEYDHEMCGRLCKLISDLIKCRIEEVCEEQYKITVNVFIGAIRGEGIDAASQCTWSPECDRFATASYKNESLFAVGIVFAMYNY